MKFSIAMLLFVVSLSAVGCAALINANGVWRQSMVTLTVACLSIAAIAGTVNRTRSFAIGFAVAGWIYFVLAFATALDVRNDLLTERTVGWLLKTIHGKGLTQQSVTKLVFTADGRQTLTPPYIKIWDPNNDFADAGHALWTLIVAFLGGILASVLASRNSRGRDTSGHGT